LKVYDYPFLVLNIPRMDEASSYFQEEFADDFVLMKSKQNHQQTLPENMSLPHPSWG